MLLNNREFEQRFSLIQSQMITQSHISIAQGGLQCKLNDGACAIIQYPIVEVKHIWQVYVTSELKIKLVCFFSVRAIILIFIAEKNRYLNLSTVLSSQRLKMNQNKSKRSNATRNQQQRLVTSFSLPCPQPGRF